MQMVSTRDFSDINMSTVSPNLPRFRGPRFEALNYTKENFGEILFHRKPGF